MKNERRNDIQPESSQQISQLLQERNQAWHRPTVSFVPLVNTSFNSGSPIDGSSSGSISG